MNAKLLAVLLVYPDEALVGAVPELRGACAALPRAERRALASQARTSAVVPCSVMFAPSLTSSGTCMKRFSNTVSRNSEAPGAQHISAMNCA